MIYKPAILALANGMILEGISAGADGVGMGELVFNTSMTGYQEMLTDPSYAQQIITLTVPHVGNVGCNTDDMESSRVWAAGLVMRDCASLYSNYRAERSLTDWLKRQGVVAIAGIDTRALTLLLREQGAMGACITTTLSPSKAIEEAKAFGGMEAVDLARVVSRQTIQRWHEGRGAWAKQSSSPSKFHVVVYDFGVKQTILRIFHDLGCHLTIVPAQTSAEEVIALNPDGVFLSNGPGDPMACDYAISATQQFLAKNIPLLGICLGFQILGLACGARSLKMKFGHHGANHPVINLDTNRVYITSQNHGFAIDEATLPANLRATHRSLFDQSLQGIVHCEKPALGFQGHPEASPGPHDIEGFFGTFIQLMQEWSNR